MSIKYISVILIFAISTSVAQTSDTTKIGIYITSVYDLDYHNNSFAVEYWLWRLNSNREFKEFYLFEAANAKDTKMLFSSTEWSDQTENQIIKGKDTIFWDYENFRSTIKHDYDITQYPFDEEILTLEFEGSTYYDDWVKMEIDQRTSGSFDLNLNGWEVGKISIEKMNTTYSTNFGSPADTTSHTYSGFIVKIPIKRTGTSLFFKLFAGLFVAFIIALFSLRINIAEADGRFGVCVGALFAALANMYIVNSNLPMVSKFTFMDKAHILVIFLILILFVTSTFSLQFYKKEEFVKSKRIDRAITFLVIFLFITGMFIIWP